MDGCSWTSLLLRNARGGLVSQRGRASGSQFCFPFFPKKGVESVLIKPAPMGGLQLVPLPKQAVGWSCIFLHYKIERVVGNDTDAKIEDGWIYGAKIIEVERRMEIAQVAVPTGARDDIIKGHLICWPPDKFKLAKIDKLMGYTVVKARGFFIRRGLVSVVRKDGSTKIAFFYYRDAEESKESKDTPEGIEPDDAVAAIPMQKKTPTSETDVLTTEKPIAVTTTKPATTSTTATKATTTTTSTSTTTTSKPTTTTTEKPSTSGMTTEEPSSTTMKISTSTTALPTTQAQEPESVALATLAAPTEPLDMEILTSKAWQFWFVAWVAVAIWYKLRGHG
eukprot:gb/GEZN01004578.1/.p1 GENE.gb/GEZN01004578.1/~~gb/GEZN01004578.1/.p1  ORF type:complete len:336 (-),score=37.37 gb/GEZN01004578.1/:770-1777(-)